MLLPLLVLYVLSLSNAYNMSPKVAISRRSAKLRMGAPFTFYDSPVSNNGARVRMIIKSKGLEKKAGVIIDSPASLGGLKSEAYLALNPQVKCPIS